jgi:hypothetical protein
MRRTRGQTIGEVVVSAPRERRKLRQWHESSTDLVERYELSLRGARGIVIRQRSDGGGYSACVGYEGRQQWARQLFGDVQAAQAWCESELVARTRNEGKLS